MTGLTPDPMTSPAPDVTKWEAAKQGVSAFLLDCEAALRRGRSVRCERREDISIAARQRVHARLRRRSVRLIKPAGAYSATAFDAAIAPLAPGGGTPLADALVDVHATIVVAALRQSAR